jgi:hypothetical protein
MPREINFPLHRYVIKSDRKIESTNSSHGLVVHAAGHMRKEQPCTGTLYTLSLVWIV